MSEVIPRVSFEVPDTAKMEEDGLLCADMHFHTSCSDSFTDVFKAVKLAKNRKTGLAITDHNLISSLERLDLKNIDVFVIPGMEVSTSDGPHILTYFYDYRDLSSFWMRVIRPRLQSNPWLALEDCTTEQLLDHLEKENCVVSAAHPMGYLGTNKGVEICHRKGFIPEETVMRLDAYEVICSGMTRLSNETSLEAATRYGLGFTGGSDGHRINELGNVVTVSDSTNIDGFLDSILKKRNRVVGLEKTIAKKIGTGSASAMKFAQHAPSAIHVQSKQAQMSVKRGLRRI